MYKNDRVTKRNVYSPRCVTLVCEETAKATTHYWKNQIRRVIEKLMFLLCQ